MPAEKTHVNTLGMRLVRIEPGSFMMGSLEAATSTSGPSTA